MRAYMRGKMVSGIIRESEHFATERLKKAESGIESARVKCFENIKSRQHAEAVCDCAASASFPAIRKRFTGRRIDEF